MKTLIIFTLLVLSACSPKNNLIEQGEKLFNQKHLGESNVMGCVSCHSIKPNQVIVGPSLAGLSLRAPYLVPSETAQEYIENSIINPDAYIVEGFLPAIMYSHYNQVLSTEEIDALVVYLSQL